MQIQTVVYIIIAIIAAIAAAYFQYSYRVKSMGRIRMLFAFLRFISVFCLLLLLINPEIKSRAYSIEKPELNIVIDNSKSIAYFSEEDQIRKLIDEFKSSELSGRFNVHFYSLSDNLNPADSFDFKGTHTNIYKGLKQLEQLNKEKNSSTILLSDGNQTIGSAYEFYSRNGIHTVNPVVIGDTTHYSDLRIERLNINRYAFLKNKFPVEIIAVYEGKQAIDTRLIISSGNKVLFSEKATFSEQQRSRIFNPELEATEIGLKSVKVELQAFQNEKNIENNIRRTAIEVIDQKTRVAVISNMIHPDLGAFKKIIESNEQRTADIIKPGDNFKASDYQSYILYQPDNSFKVVFDRLQKEEVNLFIVTGPQTDWNFLNRNQLYFSKETSFDKEDVLPAYNPSFRTFVTEDPGFSNYPPLKTIPGDLFFIIPYDVLLYQQIGNVQTTYPLLMTMEDKKRRQVLLDGEGIWKWRAQSFLNDQNFEEFDAFFGKIIQFLATNQKRDRLSLYWEPFYYGNAQALIKAEFFDKNYIFDPGASLNLTVKNKLNGEQSSYPMLLKNNHYEIDLSTIPAGDYDFTVRSASENIARSGSFTILEFDVERQFTRASNEKLAMLAANTSGKVYYPQQLGELEKELMEDERFTPVQKSTEEIRPLIDWKWLLGLIILSLSLEWFIRKYNGLI